jgi:hypothetical protein
MNKKFCDICGKEIYKKDRDTFENSIFIRVEHDIDKYNLVDICNSCLGEFLITFDKFIRKEIKELEGKRDD